MTQLPIFSKLPNLNLCSIALITIAALALLNLMDRDEPKRVHSETEKPAYTEQTATQYSFDPAVTLREHLKFNLGDDQKQVRFFLGKPSHIVEPNPSERREGFRGGLWDYESKKFRIYFDSEGKVSGICSSDPSLLPFNHSGDYLDISEKIGPAPWQKVSENGSSLSLHYYGLNLQLECKDGRVKYWSMITEDFFNSYGPENPGLQKIAKY